MVVANPGHAFLRRITSLWDVGVAEAFLFQPTIDLSDKAAPLFNLPESDAKPPHRADAEEAGRGFGRRCRCCSRCRAGRTPTW